MRKMRVAASVLLGVVLSLALVACGARSEAEDPGTITSESASAATSGAEKNEPGSAAELPVEVDAKQALEWALANPGEPRISNGLGVSSWLGKEFVGFEIGAAIPEDEVQLAFGQVLSDAYQTMPAGSRAAFRVEFFNALEGDWVESIVVAQAAGTWHAFRQFNETAEELTWAMP